MQRQYADCIRWSGVCTDFYKFVDCNRSNRQNLNLFLYRDDSLPVIPVAVSPHLNENTFYRIITGAVMNGVGAIYLRLKDPNI